MSETLNCTLEDAKKRINKVIVEKLSVAEEEVVEEANIKDDLGADSLDVVEVVMGIEDDFGIEIPDEDVDSLRTVGDVYAYAQKRFSLE